MAAGVRHATAKYEATRRIVGDAGVVEYGSMDRMIGGRQADYSDGYTYGHWAGANIQSATDGCTSGPILQWGGSGNYKAGMTNEHCINTGTTWDWWWNPTDEFYYGAHHITDLRSVRGDVAIIRSGTETYDDRIYYSCSGCTGSLDVSQAYDFPYLQTGVCISTRDGSECGYTITTQTILKGSGSDQWFSYGLQRGDNSWEAIGIVKGDSGSAVYKWVWNGSTWSAAITGVLHSVYEYGGEHWAAVLRLVLLRSGQAEPFIAEERPR